MDTNKFTVADTTGDTAIAGTLAVTGATTLTGVLTANGGVAGNLTGDVTGNVTGNASTATALAANPTDCGANTWATTIAANGDLTCVAVSGGAGITNDTIVDADINASAAIALSKLASGAGTQIIVTDTGVPQYATMSGDATITALGVLTIAADAVTSAKIAANTVAMADLARSTAGYLIIAQGAGVDSAYTVVSGDATLAADGTLTIAANAVGSSEITDSSITTDDIAANTIAAGDIATNAVTTDEILDNTITGGDLATNIGITTTGAVNLGEAASFEVPNGTDLPATCAIGQLFHDTDSNDCANTAAGDGALCICKTANTWVLLFNF